MHLPAAYALSETQPQFDSVIPILQHIPASLRSELANTGIGFFDSPGVALDKNASKSALQGQLVATANAMLLPDSRFRDVAAIVSGKPVDQVFFAESLAAFLTDPNFHCGYPMLDRYFRQRYEIPPAINSCPTLIPFQVVERHSAPQVAWLDPARVLEIRLLFGGEGQKIASRFGHVALHVVVCPEGKQGEESCNTNLFEHLVLGFMAHIDEFELSAFKALWGDYKSYLFAFKFMDIYKDYAINEFRNIYSLPLLISPEEKRRALLELAEIHWGFQGEYRFFTNNCASLLQQALRTIFPAVGSDEELSGTFVRPDRMFAAYKKSKFGAGSKLQQKESAERAGYYFSSAEGYYQKAFSVVHAAMTQPLFETLDEYLHMAPSTRRTTWVADKPYFDRLMKEPHLLGAQRLLEELALVRSERRFLAQGSRYLQHLDIVTRKQEVLKQLDADQAVLFNDCVLAPVLLFTRPIPRLAGIPGSLDAESTLNQQITSCRTPERQKKISELLKKLNRSSSNEMWENLVASSEAVEITLESVIILKELQGNP